MLFKNREQAGRELAEQLSRFRESDPIVLALPRGGVVVGYPIARQLEAPLDVMIVRKLGAPGYEEFGFGAVGPGGVRILSERAIDMLGLGQDQIDSVVEKELAEMDRRMRRYRGERAEPVIKGRTAIIVDDGLATGVTARAAIAAVRVKECRRVILAVPVAPADAVAELLGEVDELICLATPEPFHAIGQWYDSFEQTSDEEVVELLERAHQEHEQAAGQRR